MKELLERRANVWHAMKALLAATDGRTMSETEKDSWNKMEGDLSAITEAIRIQERGQALAAELDGPADLDAHIEPHPATPDGPAGTAAAQGVVRTSTPGNFGRDWSYAQAFEAYLRNGYDRLNAEQRASVDREYRDGLTTVTGNIGGYTVPPGFLQKLTDSQKAFGGMLDVTNVIDTSTGNPLQWPTSDDTGTSGAIVTEAVAHTIDASTPFGTKTLGSFLYSSKIVKVSAQLLQDSAFDLESWLSLKLGQRIGRIVNNHLTNGTGAGAQPSGLVPGLSVGKQDTGTFATTPITYADIIDVIHSVDPAYRNERSRWMMSDALLKLVRKLVDGSSRPLWEPSLQVGVPDSLLGYPITINQDMPAPAATAKSAAFGDFNAAYVTRRVLGTVLLRLNELYAAQLQVGFLAFARYDGVVDDSGAAKLYQHSAT